MHTNVYLNLYFQMQSRLPVAISRLLPLSGRYQILYSDYSNFSILYSCSGFGIAHAGK